jgi:nucleoside-diphosphate-sugar epimerase
MDGERPRPRARGRALSHPREGAGPDAGDRAAGREIFLTGATGFIGRRLAAALAARGHRLRCLVRDTAAARPLEELGARLIQGDITDDIALQYGLQGVDCAYHLAAIYDVGVVDEGAMERVNVDGTRAFLLVAETLRVPRLVYVSTTAALGPEGTAKPAETHEYDGPYPSVYHRTKAHAHRIARRAQERGLPLIIICPANVYGPGDRGPNGRFMSDVLRRRLPGLLSDSGWYSYVHVDDVVRGLLAAGESGRTGETYVLSGEPASVNAFAARVAALGGVKAPPLRMPTALVRAAGIVLDAIARATRLRFPISREVVDVSAGLRWVHGHEKATRELGWQPRSLDEGLPPTVAWMCEEIARKRSG